MAKTKADKVVDKSVKKDKKVKNPDAVTEGRVEKKSKGVVEQVKDVAKKASKKVKEVVKEPTPSSSSSSESDSDESMADAKSDSDSDSDSDSSASEVETVAPKANGVDKKAVKPAKDDDSSDSDSDDSSDSDDEAKPNTNGAAKDESSDSGSDSSDSSDDEEEKPAPVADKKRKAETQDAPAAKKAKLTKPDGTPLSNPTNKLFIGNLSWNVDEEWLQSEFAAHGEVSSVRIITDRESGRSKGFGYVEFTSTEEAEKAIAAKLGAELDGRQINVDFSEPRPERTERTNDRAQRFGDKPQGAPTATLFLGSISFDANENAISEAFSSYGTINSVRLPTDRETGQMKGFGYLEFSSVDEAVGAMAAMQGADVCGRPLRLDYAQPRQENSFGGGNGGGGFGGRGRGGDRGRGGRGGRGGDRGGRGGRGGSRGGSFNRGGFGDFQGKKQTF